jgi:hypothetical protein
LETMEVLQTKIEGGWRETMPTVSLPWPEQKNTVEIFQIGRSQWSTFFCLVWTCDYLKAKWKPEFDIPHVKINPKPFNNKLKCGSAVIYLALVSCFLSTHRL